MPISVGVNGTARNITDIYVGGQSGRLTIVEGYVGDANGSPRLVWRRVKPITASIRVEGGIYVGSVVNLIAYDVAGGGGRYTYVFMVNGSVVRTITDVTNTQMSTTYTPQYAGYYQVSVTVSDANDPSNFYTANGGFTVINPMVVTATATPDSALLGTNIQFSWTVQQGEAPYRAGIIVFRDGASVYMDFDVASPFYYSTDSGFGTYTAQIFITDAIGSEASAYTNGVSVYAYGYTATTSVNVRAGAGTSYDIVGSFAAAGTMVNVFSSTFGDDGNTWYYITHGSTSGYIRSDLLVVP